MLPLHFFKSLIPSACLLCHGALRGMRPLCAGCLRDLPWNDDACLRCAMPMSVSDRVCGDCLQAPPQFDHAFCAFRYEPPVSVLLNRYKHSGRLVCGHWLSRSLAQQIQAHYRTQALPLPDCIMPVPLHWRRLQQRGFDQGLEIARVLTRQLGLPLSTALRRQRNTASQQGLSREQRQTNLAGAFVLRQPLPYRRIALVDDVLTTGSTASVLSVLLRKAGADTVHLWAIARTP